MRFGFEMDEGCGGREGAPGARRKAVRADLRSHKECHRNVRHEKATVYSNKVVEEDVVE